MGLISRLKEKAYYNRPHWQVFNLEEDGRKVCCSNCGYEAEERPVYIPEDTDTLMDIAMGDIHLEDGYLMAKSCPNCGAVMGKEDLYFIPALVDEE